MYYGATQMEARTCQGNEVIVVGGGNSAGQAAIFLANHASHVHLVIRRQDLSATMSAYLIKRIENHPNITLIPHTEVTALEGSEHLERVTLHHSETKKDTVIDVANLFLFIGAEPCSDWIGPLTCTDGKGFILTGRDITKPMLQAHHWPLEREPYDLESCVPGLFAVGDIRSGSTKRVASAVGEGAMAVSHIHAFLKP